MAVVVRSRIQELTEQVKRWTYSSSLSGHACGIILARCADFSRRSLLEKLKTHMSKEEPQLSAQYFYDDENQVLGVALENERLANTHFVSLIVKDFLTSHHLLPENIAVASFPECGLPTDHLIQQFVHTAVNEHRNDKDIRLFVPEMETGDIDSVLVVDTDDMIREFLKIRLELKGYTVFEARDGHEAFDLYSEILPDLVITELSLPILDGYQLIDEIKASGGSESKVIVLTDKQSTESMNRAFEWGASDYVTKPFSIAELEWRIKKLKN
jgi:two-component system, OmpR family, response regulator